MAQLLWLTCLQPASTPCLCRRSFSL